MPGQFRNDKLQTALEKMHIDLEQPSAQKPPRNGHKKNGRQVLPPTTNNLMENAMNSTATDSGTTNAAPAAPAGSPEDRIASQLAALNARFAPKPAWQQAAGIGVGVVLGTLVVTGGVYFGTKLATRGSAAAKPIAK